MIQCNLQCQYKWPLWSSIAISSQFWKCALCNAWEILWLLVENLFYSSLSLSRSLFLPFSQAHVINFSYWSYVYSFSVRCCIFFFLHEKNFIFIQFIVSYACYITNKFFKWKKERYEMSTQRTGNTIIIINYTKSLSNDTKKECKCFLRLCYTNVHCCWHISIAELSIV